MHKFFRAFHDFLNVSAETQERRERDGLTQEEEREFTAIQESPAVKEFRTYMEKPTPQVRDALCKRCGKLVVNKTTTFFLAKEDMKGGSSSSF